MTKTLHDLAMEATDNWAGHIECEYAGTEQYAGMIAAVDAHRLEIARAGMSSGTTAPSTDATPSVAEAAKHLRDIINFGNCFGSRQSAMHALRALAAQTGGE